MSNHDPQTAYDRVAEEYARQMLHELDHKPLDRELLERFAAQTNGKGRVVDLGCGPGQIARYLHDHDADAFGIDLSPAMVNLARREHPGMEFQQGDMHALDLPDNSLAGIAAFYSIIHIPRAEVTSVLKELRRILQPNGLLLMSFHCGSEVYHRDEWWEQPVSVDFIFFQPDEMIGYLKEAGLLLDEVVERDPYPDGSEAQTHRAYIFARRPEQ